MVQNGKTARHQFFQYEKAQKCFCNPMNSKAERNFENVTDRGNIKMPSKTFSEWIRCIITKTLVDMDLMAWISIDSGY